MSKFNKPVAVAARTTSPIVSTTPATTHQGGAGFARDAKSELFLLAVTNMVGENTFYETAGARDTRFEELVHQVAVLDGDWMRRSCPARLHTSVTVLTMPHHAVPKSPKKVTLTVSVSPLMRPGS